MRKSRFCLPILILAAANGLWFQSLHQQGSILSLELSRRRAAEVRPAAPLTHEVTSATIQEAVLLRKHISEISSELQREQRAAIIAQNGIAELQSQFPPNHRDQVVLSYGRVAYMGKNIGSMMHELLRWSQGQAASKEDVVFRNHLKLLAWMPSISKLEEQPDQIAILQSTILREMFQFDEMRTERAKDIIERAFTSMKAAGLTSTRAEDINWRGRRGTALTALLWELRPLLPPDFKDPQDLLPQVVNIGGGTEFKPDFVPKAINVVVSGPTWPRAPWLPQPVTNKQEPSQ